MKVSVKHNMMFIVSDYSLDELRKVERYHHEAMLLYAADGAEVFRVTVSPMTSNVGNYGICFAYQGFDGKAVFNCQIPYDRKTAEDVREWIIEEYGVILQNLSAVEEKISNAMNEIAATEAAVNNMIVIETDSSDDEVGFES